MKSKIIASFAILAVFGLAIATYAYTQTNTAKTDKASCCKNSNSCPMKAKISKAATAEHSGDSCPMKAQMAGTTVSGENNCCDSCSGACCGDSCPMKKGGDAQATAISVTETGKDCCDNCDCCAGKNESAV